MLSWASTLLGFEQESTGPTGPTNATAVCMGLWKRVIEGREEGIRDT